MSKTLTDTQEVVLRALVAGCDESPMSSKEVGVSRICREKTGKYHPGSWASSRLRALEQKGLVYTDAPGAARGYWRPTELGVRMVAVLSQA